MTTLVERAARFAAAAHADQKRKYTSEPYFTHVEAVAKAVTAAGGDEATVAAAYLHDTLEDTATTYGELVAEFGAEIADMVVELTDVYTPGAYPHLNRKTRKAREAERLAGISDRAKLIKRADIRHNCETIERYDPRFAKIYLPEKRHALSLMDAS